MKIIPIGNKYGVAIDGRVEAFYDTIGEAAKHVGKPKQLIPDEPKPFKPMEAREVPEIPHDLPEDLKVTPPYELVRDREDS